MNGINSKDRFSFAKGYRARTIFLIFDILLLGILMCMMVPACSSSRWVLMS